MRAQAARARRAEPGVVSDPAVEPRARPLTALMDQPDWFCGRRRRA